MIDIQLGDSGQRLIFSNAVLRHFNCYQQSRSNPNEAGGQLFAVLDAPNIEVVVATGPRPTDRRSPVSYIPDRYAEKREISDFFERGMHFVGDWHTHPERNPSPSFVDKANMRDCFNKSLHGLNFFILVVVGNDPSSMNISVNMCNCNNWFTFDCLDC